MAAYTVMAQSNYALVVKTAICVVQPTSLATTNISGTIQFTQNDKVLDVSYNLAGLSSSINYIFHVHTLALWSADAMATTGHLGLCPPSPAAPCRPNAPVADQYNIGYILNSTFTPDATGVAMNTFSDTLAALNGPYSIIGRSIVIHNAATNARLAQCVIGRNDAATTNVTVEAGPTVTKATCKLTGTTAGNEVSTLGNVTGLVSFEATSATEMLVTYSVTGLTAGTHGFHVHHLGNVVDGNRAMSTGAHFVGDCSVTSPCRPAGVTQEVGYLGDGFLLNSTLPSYVASGSFVEKVATLNGIRSIIGRSIVIHGPDLNGVASARMAQCVIGISATSSVTPSSNNPASSEGLTTAEKTAIIVIVVFVGVVILGFLIKVAWSRYVNKNDSDYFHKSSADGHFPDSRQGQRSEMI